MSSDTCNLCPRSVHPKGEGEIDSVAAVKCYWAGLVPCPLFVISDAVKSLIRNKFAFLGGVMRMPKCFVFLSVCFIAIFVGCEKPNENANTTATTTVSPPATQNLTVVPRPQKIVDMMKARGEQDEAKPTLRILSPAKNATISGSTVDVKLELNGDLKGYKPHKDPATGKGNHIHVILDNQPYEAYYELDQPFQLL